MHIGFDITSLVFQRGVSRYTGNLVRSLLAAGTEVSLLGYSMRKKSLLDQFVASIKPKSLIHSSIYPLSPNLVNFTWQYFGWPNPVQSLPGMQLFHSWDWQQPPHMQIPLISTIHDVAILKYPETAHPLVKKRHEQSWSTLKKRQARLIAVSQATKRDLVELLGYPSYLIHVVHEALPEEFRQLTNGITEEEEQMVIQKLNLSKPFVLFVGTREPRKNLARLIEAWRPLASDFQLIVAGESGWDGVSEQQHTDQLRFLGRVTDTELSVLYGQASCFAYPSLYEGFGLPILESFHHGTAVITSDNSGMREVAGNAAELIDPISVESIRKGLTTVLSESIPDQQKRLQRMIIRQQMFSWDRVAHETLAVYKQALSEIQ